MLKFKKPIIKTATKATFIYLLMSVLLFSCSKNSLEDKIKYYVYETVDDPTGYEAVKYGKLVRVERKGQFLGFYMYFKYRHGQEGSKQLEDLYLVFDKNKNITSRMAPLCELCTGEYVANFGTVEVRINAIEE